MAAVCPECQIRHRSFPRRCYYAVHADAAHATIARLASKGDSDQQEWARKASERWATMQEYAKSWPNEVKR